MNNRLIKFRTFDLEKAQMREVAAIEFIDEEVSAVQIYSKDKKSVHVREDDIILMQFTGLKDKNGKDIFEGDIVKAAPMDKDYGKVQIGFIDYFAPRFGVKVEGLGTIKFFEGRSEVIGNIYTNPELLK